MALKSFWYLGQYNKPRIKLRPDAIRDNGDGALLIDDEDVEFEVEFESNAERDDVRDLLRALCDPDSARWPALRSDPAEGRFGEVVDALYVAGIVDEAASPTPSDLTNAPWRRLTLRYAQSVLADIEAKDSDALRRMTQHVDWLSAEAERLLAFADGNASQAVAAGYQGDLWTQQNFNLITMIVQMRYACRNNPPGLRLIAACLSVIRAGLAKNAEATPDLALDASVSPYLEHVYHARDAEACLYAFCEFLRESVTPQAIRLTRLSGPRHGDVTGIGFALESERYAKERSVDLGESRFLATLQDPENHMLLAPACYLQEYFVNYRFVETITPMITKRLRPKFKQMFWRYYSEEIGHENFELDTCIKLDISEEFIASHLPLPMTQAFCDAYSYLAECEELGYLTSVMVTEGIPGEPSLINRILSDSPVLRSRFNEASLAHEELNQELGHQFLSRIFLAEIARIPPEAQRRALDILSYMVELNFRAWEDLHRRILLEGQPYMAPSLFEEAAASH
ncbi:MAG: hypothetical protein E6Q88_03655 [Lysobacteraceae bacterium]|nr:MAG: hypothetical protein E6Q88_03655 [Xanthomonadaceae bacterium]